MRLISSFIALGAVAAFVTPVAATTIINAGVEGTISFSPLTPQVGQTSTLNGSFSSYSASINLPQIGGNDLDKYSFVVTGTSDGLDATTRTMTYCDATILGYG
jgi:hypothetical protein